ncbi:MAG: alanine--glyoxylate aminotransferase family protein [Candidatus Saganbacteria bacterium]|nr:alanine--glyoxylate aminotransferase family protein [Candidatus Saganbacteria bacterium]
MESKQYLLIPGPTPVPDSVRQAEAQQMIGHRSSDFTKIFGEVQDGLKQIYHTKNPVFIIPSSGTGGMEAAIVNTLSPGDKILLCNIGDFGKRWGEMAKAYGIVVQEIKKAPGQVIDPKEVAAALDADKNKEIKAVLFQQNETSTGALNPVKEIGEIVAKSHAISIVDSISGMLTAPMKVDEWGLDIVISGSQKAYMIPPGLAFVSVGPRVWPLYEKSKCPKYYFDFKQFKKFDEKKQTPTTTPVSLIYALQAALRLILAEGIENGYKRHAAMASFVRSEIRKWGLKLMAEDKAASMSVTAIWPPEGIDPEAMRKELKSKYNVVVAGGQGELNGKIFRIGHMGGVTMDDLKFALDALKKVLAGMGYKFPEGVA